VKVWIVPNLDVVSARKGLDLVWQLVRDRHVGTVDQEWDYWDRPAKSGRNLDAYKVVWIIELGRSLWFGLEPARADYN
jgi:hypothetical protein